MCWRYESCTCECPGDGNGDAGGGGRADLLVKRCAGGDDLRLAEPGSQIYLEAPTLERCTLHDEALVQRVSFCTRQGGHMKATYKPVPWYQQPTTCVAERLYMGP